MKKLLTKFFCLGFSLVGICTTAQKNMNMESIVISYENDEWLNGLTTIKPHTSINRDEINRQQLQLSFLQTNDLESLKNGVHVIEEGNVMAFVSEEPAREMNQIKWETHRNFNNLQYVIKGKAKMGIYSRDSSDVSITEPYDSKKDVEIYSIKGGTYFIAEPGTYFIFSPKEIHRPAIKFEGYDTIKKILIKVRVANSSP